MVCSSHACPSLALLRGPSKSGMVMASIMMDQMLLACQGFTHVKKVVAAVAVCLEQALGMLASSGAEGNWSFPDQKLKPDFASANHTRQVNQIFPAPP